MRPRVAAAAALAAVLTLPAGARVLPPMPIPDLPNPRLAAVTNSGHLLVFPVADLPEMPRGKGNKIIALPAAKGAERQDWLVAAAVVREGGSLIIASGKRTFTLKPADLDLYQGERGRRGRPLPRGFQRVDGLTAE